MRIFVEEIEWQGKNDIENLHGSNARFQKNPVNTRGAGF